MMKRPFSSIQLQIRGNLPEDMQAFLTSFRNSVGVRAFLQICESSVQKKQNKILKKILHLSITDLHLLMSPQFLQRRKLLTLCLFEMTQPFLV